MHLGMYKAQCAGRSAGVDKARSHQHKALDDFGITSARDLPLPSFHHQCQSVEGCVKLVTNAFQSVCYGSRDAMKSLPGCQERRKAIRNQTGLSPVICTANSSCMLSRLDILIGVQKIGLPKVSESDSGFSRSANIFWNNFWTGL